MRIVIQTCCGLRMVYAKCIVTETSQTFLPYNNWPHILILRCLVPSILVLKCKCILMLKCSAQKISNTTLQWNDDATPALKKLLKSDLFFVIAHTIK